MGAFDRSVIALREMLEASQLATPATRLRVSIEPHIDSIAQKPDDALRLIADVPGLTLTLDWAHLVCQGIPVEDIAALLPDTRHVQIRQAARGRLQTPFDDGQVDAAQVLTTLQAGGYEGVVCVEYMKMPGWHGMMEVNAVQESARLRDALRTARDKASTGK
ncbi:sugar phosphate isomerase/epimerase [bacterium]|nr:sugar phosphate isomerase/epimerase [bacterium]